MPSRSRLTVEDLATKIGTVVNGTKIRGSKYVGNGQDLEVTMGKCSSKFKYGRPPYSLTPVADSLIRVSWLPIVLTFSFTSKELQMDPLTTLRQQFESLDMKLLTDYSIEYTTHVVSRKRNTAKGLQALINAKFVVTETFLDAVLRATEAGADAEPCALEQDFDQSWPDAMKHLPPRGGEPVQHPDSIYAPDKDRKEVFDGYTFIFYDKTQYSNLMAPITNGGGKAVLHLVSPYDTRVDDFVRAVKEVAGEKGLGSFEDGSEGKGVVLVRYLPAKGDSINWYAEFITSVSLRLDHRPIEQNEFLEAILTNDASKLRRPLEVETAISSQASIPAESSSAADDIAALPEVAAERVSRARLSRATRPAKRRFAGFDDEADVDMTEVPEPPTEQAPTEQAPTQHLPRRSDGDEGGLFVSQEDDSLASQQDLSAVDNSRKRQLPDEESLMTGLAPAVARFKRQRLETGNRFASPSPEPVSQPSKGAAKGQKVKMDILAMAARNREEEEARARAEREDLANLPDDVDLAEIRRLQIVEEVEVKMPNRGARTREQDIADGRWDPKWNGVKNFKKFRRRGEVVGRQPVRAIVELQEVRTKEFGIGDNYWLDDEGAGRKTSAASVRSRNNTQTPAGPSGDSAPFSEPSPLIHASEDEEGGEESGIGVTESNARQRRAAASGTGSTNIAETPTQRASTSSTRQSRATQGKRPAPPDTSSSIRAKRAKTASRTTHELDGEESEDELKFRFGRRR